MNIRAQVTKKTINIGGRLLSFSEPRVMGILNATPDSFFAGSRLGSLPRQIAEQGRRMLSDGADLLDIGGYSTRPGAAEISVAEEIDRVVPVVEVLIREFPEVIISVDTFRSEVARQAVRAGAALVNDVSGGDLDPGMFEAVAALRVPYVLMHMRGNPRNMASLTNYEHLVTDVLRELRRKQMELYNLGVTDVIVDPGFGFAKTNDQNFELMRDLEAFQQLGAPVLVGISRKGMIWKSLEITADQALNGTTALHMFALCRGADMLRAHDVKEAKETIELYKRLIQ